MLGLLSDPGPACRAGRLNFSLGGDLKNVDHMLLEKRDGTFFLTLWIEELGYDVNAKKVVPVGDRNIEVKLAAPAGIRVHKLTEDGRLTPSEAQRGASRKVEVSDRVTILEISR